MPETHTGHSRRNGRHFDYGAACGVTGADPFFIAGQRAQHGRQEHSVITAGLARQIGEQNFKAASIAGAGHVQGSQRAVAGMHRAVQDGGRKFHAFELGSRGENLCGQGWHAVAHAVHAADQDALRLPGRGCVHAPRDKPRGLQRSDEARHKGIVRIQAEIPVLPAVSGSQAGQEAKSLEEPVCAEQTVGMSVRKFIDMRQRAPGHEAFRGTPKHVNGGRADGERAGAAGDERDFLALTGSHKSGREAGQTSAHNDRIGLLGGPGVPASCEGRSFRHDCFRKPEIRREAAFHFGPGSVIERGIEGQVGAVHHARHFHFARELPPVNGAHALPALLHKSSDITQRAAAQGRGEAVLAQAPGSAQGAEGTLARPHAHTRGEADIIERMRGGLGGLVRDFFEGDHLAFAEQGIRPG